jgi:hypothetical protein
MLCETGLSRPHFLWIMMVVVVVVMMFSESIMKFW